MKKLFVGMVAFAVMGVRSVMAAQDWASVSTAVTGEIAAVMPVALTVFGAVIAVVIGVKVFKRIAG